MGERYAANGFGLGGSGDRMEWMRAEEGSVGGGPGGGSGDHRRGTVGLRGEYSEGVQDGKIRRRGPEGLSADDDRPEVYDLRSPKPGVRSRRIVSTKAGNGEKGENPRAVLPERDRLQDRSTRRGDASLLRGRGIGSGGQGAPHFGENGGGCPGGFEGN